MKINQVEELTGVTKKNIRFYEEQKLISPQRNPANGYREYSMEDVKQLSRIKARAQRDRAERTDDADSMPGDARPDSRF